MASPAVAIMPKCPGISDIVDGLKKFALFQAVRISPFVEMTNIASRPQAGSVVPAGGRNLAGFLTEPMFTGYLEFVAPVSASLECR